MLVAVELGGLGLLDRLVGDAPEVEKRHFGDQRRLLGHVEVRIEELRVRMLLNISLKGPIMNSPWLVMAASTVVILLSDLRNGSSRSTSIPVVATSGPLARSRLPTDTSNQVISCKARLGAFPSQLGCLAVQMRAGHADVVAQSAGVDCFLGIHAHVAAEHWLVLLVIIFAWVPIGVLH